ncbi:MAG: hypothetical protein R2688_06250 [Fimbriimonadaceae bacterium]
MKLSAITWIIVGLSIFLASIGFAFFQYWKPNTEEAKNYKAWQGQLEAEGAKLPAAKARFEKAQEKVMEQNDAWNQIVLRKTPTEGFFAGGVDLATNRYDMTHLVRKFRNEVQRDVNNQMRRGGVLVVQGPTVPTPPDDPAGVVSGYFNYPAAGTPVAIFDLGQVTIRGTWSQISANIQAWSEMPNYLAVADGLSISHFVAFDRDHNVTVVAFLQGKHSRLTLHSAQLHPLVQHLEVPGAPNARLLLMEVETDNEEFFAKVNVMIQKGVVFGLLATSSLWLVVGRRIANRQRFPQA